MAKRQSGRCEVRGLELATGRFVKEKGGWPTVLVPPLKGAVGFPWDCLFGSTSLSDKQRRERGNVAPWSSLVRRAFHRRGCAVRTCTAREGFSFEQVLGRADWLQPTTTEQVSPATLLACHNPVSTFALPSPPAPRSDTHVPRRKAPSRAREFPSDARPFSADDLAVNIEDRGLTCRSHYSTLMGLQFLVQGESRVAEISSVAIWVAFVSQQPAFH
jgi:hypothetical protein